MTNIRERTTATGHGSAGRDQNTVVLAAVVCLGFVIACPPADLSAFRWPASLVIGVFVGLMGWRRVVTTYSLKRYLSWAFFLGAWLVVSAVAAWSGLALYRARNYTIWIALIIPGLAMLLALPRYRRGFGAGLICGVSIFGLVMVYRLIEGREIFDRVYPFQNFILGLNRNIAAATALIVLPVLLSRELPAVLRRARWPLVALDVAWILMSRSRLVILAAVFAGLVWVLIQPGVARKGRKLLMAVFAALIVLVVIQEVGGDARIGFDRVTAGFSPEGGTNETRQFLVKKAWHLAEENPVFGIGLGRFAGAYHPVLEGASSVKVRRQATNSYDHNGYAGMMAEAGFPGLVLMLGLLLSLVNAGIRNRRSGLTHIAMVSYTVALVYLTAASLMTITFGAMALMLGAVIEAEIRGSRESLSSEPETPQG